MIAYEDDGVGFPEGFDVNEAGHMGMNFIRLLSTGLDGHHEWHSDPLGICFEIVLPIEALASLTDNLSAAPVASPRCRQNSDSRATFPMLLFARAGLSGRGQACS